MAVTTIQTPDRSYTVLTMRDLNGGFLFTNPQAEIEILTTPGVDGRRYREASHMFGEVQVETIIDCPSYATAVDTANSYRLAVGQYANIHHPAGDRTFIFRDVYVLGVVPQPRPGSTVAASANPGNEAHVYAVWTLELSEFSASESE